MIIRNIINDLRLWAKSKSRKPLILRGARQVGKTTVIDEFGKEFAVYLKLNLDKDEHIKLFNEYTDMETLITGIYLVNNKQREDVPTLLFIDEIQNSGKAVALLRYFYEEYPQLHVITAGSLLESLIDKKISFPVGRVQYMAMRPCSFNEFLNAMGKTELQKAQARFEIPSSMHDFTMSLFNQYTLVGGMPEVISNYSKNRDIIALDGIFDTLLTGYRDDVEKYADTNSMQNIMRLVLSVGWAKAGTRIKFQKFGESDYRSREMGEAFRLLEKAFVLELVYPSTSHIPPIQPELKYLPKIIWLDTGIVNYVAKIQKEIFGAKDIADVWKGNIAEHITGQEILCSDNRVSSKRNFWIRNKQGSEAEVDFIIQHDSLIIPIEVKSSHGSKLKSLHLFMDEVPHNIAIRI